MMRKVNLLLISILIVGLLHGQKNYTTKSGQIKFLSKTSLEDVEAINKQVFCSLNSATGKMQFAVLIKGFAFENSLMQKHFNEEEYLHSDKFPKSNFVGQIKNLKAITFKKNGSYKTEVAGNLTMHGVTKTVTAIGTITVLDGSIEIKSNFILKPADYKIVVPEEISNTIIVTIECKLK